MFNISGLDGGKQGKEVKVGFYVTRTLNKNSLCGKHTPYDGFPSPCKISGMKHNIFMAVHENN